MRHTFPREFYIPKHPDVAEIRDDESGAVAYAYSAGGAFYAAAFHGKAAKPDWHYRFRSEEARTARIAEHAASCRASIAYKARRKAERLATPCRLEVGSIVVASWGYDQTNVDFYQVTARIGARTVELREIGAESQETGFMSGTCSATKGAFIGEPFRRLVNGDAVKVDESRYASLWDGRPKYWSSYA